MLERYHLDFVRAGAQLKGEGRDRLAAIAQRLAVLGTQFSQNVLGDEEDWILPLTRSADGGRAARPRATRPPPRPRTLKLDAPFAVTLSRSSVEPFLQFADDRALREQLLPRLDRARRQCQRPQQQRHHRPKCWPCAPNAPRLLGYENFAAFKLADSMAGTPAKARALLEEVWEPARKRALEERDALQALIAREGGNFRAGALGLALLRRKAAAASNMISTKPQLKPYFQLSNLIEAAFFTAEKLFGLSFQRTPRHAGLSSRCAGLGSARATAQAIGLFYGDYFARAGKQGGAWMSSFRDQQKLDGDVLPIIINNCNFSKSDPCLLSFDDAVTLFHEFGHALHGLLARCASRACPAPMWRAILWNCRRSFSSIGWKSRKC